MDPGNSSHCRIERKSPCSGKSSALEESDQSIESTVISGLESVAGIFDDLQLLRSFGVISENNVFYRKLNKSGFCSKVWLVSLTLSTRKNASDIISLAVSRSRLKREQAQFMRRPVNSVRKVLNAKVTARIQEINRKLIMTALELVQNLGYLTLTAVDVLAFRLTEKWRRLLERVSSTFAIARVLFSGIPSLLL
ncbi:LAQU0S15e00254g1_1 [Lachancea quebecensis]|uniref:LAQU0S15e00254g1_1 n=1 Tax=Lachancea quebecensis TaxID=1654605 RepID=A0A0P1KWL3_9SACH|nr:LAQU0S15e00254g1_1 [Lachancea quebecensis]